MTRHEIKEQLSHDQFRDGVSAAVTYAYAHRRRVIRYIVLGVIVLALVGLGFWYAAYQRGVRQQELRAALDIWEAPVGKNAASDILKSYPTQQAKEEASLRAFADVAAKHSGSREGQIARYYVGTIRAQRKDNKGAESDLKAVADAGGDIGSLGKMALAQVYVAEGRTSDAETLLGQLSKAPTDFVSKAQSQILLAEIQAKKNPQEARKTLNALKASAKSPEISRAVDQVAAQLPK